MKQMPSYGLQVTPVCIKMAKPPMIPQEEYDRQLLDENFVRFESKCDAGRMWKWQVIIVEKVGEEQMGESIESTAFDVDVNDGSTLLREVLTKAAKMISKQASGTISDELNQSRIIIP